MSGKVNMIPTLRKFRGGPVQANLGGASLETFSGEGQLKKSPCIIYIEHAGMASLGPPRICLDWPPLNLLELAPPIIFFSVGIIFTWPDT